MERTSRTLSAATLIVTLLLSAAVPAAAGDAAWRDVTDPTGVFDERQDVTDMDGALERLASRAGAPRDYAGATERLAARLPDDAGLVVVAAPPGCGDHLLQAE